MTAHATYSLVLQQYLHGPTHTLGFCWASQWSLILCGGKSTLKVAQSDSILIYLKYRFHLCHIFWTHKLLETILTDNVNTSTFHHTNRNQMVRESDLLAH